MLIIIIAAEGRRLCTIVCLLLYRSTAVSRCTLLLI